MSLWESWNNYILVEYACIKILNAHILKGVDFSRVYICILILSLDNTETMHIKGIALTFVPSLTSVKLFHMLLLLCGWQFMGCAIFFKRGRNVTQMNLFAKLRIFLKYVANTLSHVSVISFAPETGYYCTIISICEYIQI